MHIYVYNEDIELIGVTDCYVSLIWIRRYHSAGSFELYVPMTKELAELLQPRRYIYRPDVKEAMYISGSEDTDEGEDGRFMRVTGYGIEGILQKRVIMSGKTALKILECAKSVLDNSPLADFEYSDPDGLDVITAVPTVGAELDKWIYSVCALGERDISYRVRLLPSEKKLRMELYGGRDLSDEVIFGDMYGNLNNMQYAYSEDGCANVIICRCAPVSDDNVEVEPDKGIPSYTLGEAEGLERSELLLITDPIVKTGYRYVYDADGVPQLEEYRYLAYDDTLARMKEEAAAAFSDFTENYSADALGSGYRLEWDIGDIVTVRNEMRGVSYIKRIEEVQEVFDVNGYIVTPTFGEPLKTILDLIKR